MGCGCCGRAGGGGGGGDGTAGTVVRTAGEEKSGGVKPLLPLLKPLLVVVTIAPAGLTVTLFCGNKGSIKLLGKCLSFTKHVHMLDSLVFAIDI